MKITSGVDSRVIRSEDHRPLSVCVVPEQRSATPKSPVIFDSLGLLNKNATFRAKGVFEMNFYVSNADDDPSYTGTNPITRPLEPAQWRYLGKIVGVEPRPYFLKDLVHPSIYSSLVFYRWLKFDFKRGISPQIDFYSAGT